MIFIASFAERKPGSPPDISGFDAALVSGLKHEACMLLDLEAPDEVRFSLYVLSNHVHEMS